VKLLTLQEASAMTRVSTSSLRRRCASGEIRATKPSGSWLIYEDGLHDWLRSHEPKHSHDLLQPVPNHGRLAQSVAGQANVYRLQ
jgi:excisionase family DNA binding protein